MKKIALVVVLGVALVAGSLMMANDASAWRAYCGPVGVAVVAPVVYCAPVVVAKPVYCAPAWCYPYACYPVKYKRVRGCWW
jgi:hypothetical protein